MIAYLALALGLMGCISSCLALMGKGHTPHHRHYFQELTEETGKDGEPIVKSWSMEEVPDRQ